MKYQSLKSLLFCVLFLFLFVTAAEAYDYDRSYRRYSSYDDTRFNFSVFGGGAFANDDEIDEEAFVAGRITMDVTDYAEFGVEAGYLTYEDKAGSLKFGDIDSIPIFGVVLLKLPLSEGDHRIVPYLIGGAGVMLWDYEEDDFLTTNGISVDTDASFAAKGGVGVEFYLRDNAAMFVEVSYVYSDFDAEVNAPGFTAAGEVDTDSIFVGGGFKLSI